MPIAFPQRTPMYIGLPQSNTASSALAPTNPGPTTSGPTTSGMTPTDYSQNVSPTNYMQGAFAQGQANQQAAQLTNAGARVNQNTPFGNQNYSFDPRTNQWTSNISLAPAQQNLLNAQNQQSSTLAGLGNTMAGNVAQQLSTPFSLGGTPPLIGANGFADQQNAAYGQLMGRQNQQFDIQDKALQQQLANQGLTPGSEAYNRAYQPLNQARVDASNQSSLAANQMAQSYISQANAAHQLGVNDALTQSQQPLNLLNAVRSGSQVTTPQFSQYYGANVAPAPIQSAQALQNQYNTGQQNLNTASNNNFNNGLFGLGGAILGSNWFGNLIGG